MKRLLSAVGMVLVVSGCTCGPTAAPGFSQAYTTTASYDGLHTTLVLDANDEPMIAFIREDSANPDNNALLFTRHDSRTSAWTTPVVAAANIGRTDSNPTMLQAQLARDPKTGRLGIAFQKTEQFCGPTNGNKETTVHVTFSTDQGATWSPSERVSEAKYTRNDPVNGVEVCNTSSPRIAMRDGAVHVAWHADAAEPDGLSFFRGYYHAVSTANGAWTRTLMPAGGDDARKGRGQLWLALDSAGSPAVAYEMQSDDPAVPNNVAVMYWRSGTTAVRVVDSGNRQNDVPQVALAFDGTKPRVAMHLARTGQTTTTWVYRSDDGLTFTGAAVPDDAEDTGGTWMDLSYFAGNGAITYSFDGSGAKGACGGPKISRSSDAQTWATCGADDVTHQFLGQYVSAEHDRAGKLVMAFYEDQEDTASPKRFGRGIVLYREP